ncbi:response regulator [uncultured Desulfobacter sp.]|uniref:response regulator n=1 Tax=uncultured Desulfobacter sp. TaxID=240139 RepID=UPI002AAB598E|nr:response regulator [uncultured Desulfobacter sp.]
MNSTPRRTVLCVDDEKQILSSLKRLLRKENFDLFTATNGEDGLKIMASRDIHLVISDHRMPDMSGISFLAKVRETYPDTIRILLTGYTEIDSIKASINEGHVYKFLLKPWNDDDLKQEIKKALERYDLIQLNQSLHLMVAAKNKELEQINKDLENIIKQRTRELELKNQALELTRVLFQGLPVAAMGVSHDQTIILINRQAEKLKIEGRMFTVGNLLGDYFSKHTMKTFLPVFESQINHAKSSITIEGQTYVATLSVLTGRFLGKGFILCLQEQAA